MNLLFHLLLLLLSSLLHHLVLTSTLQPAAPHTTTNITRRFHSLSFHQGYSTIWGQPKLLEDEGNVQLALDQHSGSGFMSLDDYHYGFFSASIKLPADYTAGVVIAFYTSNADDFPDNHDELDFEFLGNIRGRGWRVQTNIYGNGSVAHGREERFTFWFDPTEDFHDYSILWNNKHILFMVDNIPIREMTRTDMLGGDYPSKAMALYATIWDGSGWATDGGKYPVNYRYAPFVATFRELKLEGCMTNSMEGRQDECEKPEVINPVQASDLLLLGADQQAALEWVRTNHMYYSYCDDISRYPDPLPECSPRMSKRSITSSRFQKKKQRSSHHHSHIQSRRGRTFLSSNNAKFSIPPSVQVPAEARIRRS